MSAHPYVNTPVVDAFDHHEIYYCIYGKMVRLTAICVGVEAANQYMLAHPGEGLIAFVDGLALIADCNNLGWVALSPEALAAGSDAKEVR